VGGTVDKFKYNWSGVLNVETIGNVSKEAVEKYIEAQRGR